ncbi:MAG: hypothetical protein JO069_19630, partial [Verrucomicrobia bacterium]|nr:hypothetical protein [Verrucomicrobiota bacterium]
KFARTTDREFFVVDADGRLVGTLRLLDLIIASLRLLKENEQPAAV